jgi:hypothetical protein
MLRLEITPIDDDKDDLSGTESKDAKVTLSSAPVSPTLLDQGASLLWKK